MATPSRKGIDGCTWPGARAPHRPGAGPLPAGVVELGPTAADNMMAAFWLRQRRGRGSTTPARVPSPFRGLRLEGIRREGASTTSPVRWDVRHRPEPMGAAVRRTSGASRHAPATWLRTATSSPGGVLWGPETSLERAAVDQVLNGYPRLGDGCAPAMLREPLSAAPMPVRTSSSSVGAVAGPWPTAWPGAGAPLGARNAATTCARSGKNWFEAGPAAAAPTVPRAVVSKAWR